MIRFSAFLVVVAVGLLVAGVVTSTLLLVYIAIGVSGVALLALGIGAAVHWRELTGKPETDAAEASAQGPAPIAAGPGARPGRVGSGGRWSCACRVGLARRRPVGSVPGRLPARHRAAAESPARDGACAARRHAASPGRVHPALRGRGPRRLAVARRSASAARRAGIAAHATPACRAARLDHVTRTPPKPRRPRSAASRWTPRRPAISPRPKPSPWPKKSRRTRTSRLPTVRMRQNPKPPPASLTRLPPPRPRQTRPLPPRPSRPGKLRHAGEGGDRPGPDPDLEVTVVPGVPRYHKARCILIRFMGDSDLDKMTVAAARKAGCTPCRACLPDQPEKSPE